MKSKKARRIRLFQDLQKNSPPKWKAYFVLKFVPLDSNVVYLYHLAEETPLLYAKLALKANGLQDYVNAMNEFN